MTPFECDMCVFWKLRGEAPDSKQVKDIYLMTCIRRMNLDAFWSRATSTVLQNATNAKRMIERSEKVGIPYGPFFSEGPFPEFDHCGYQTAYLMLDASLDSGRYNNNHKQFDTIRKIRSTFSNHVRASPSTLVAGKSVVLTDNVGKSFTRLGHDESGSLWFSRFVEGCRRRMGQDWRPDQAVSPRLVAKLLEQLEESILEASTNDEAFRLVMMGTFYATTYALSLRGPEGLLLDLDGMNKFGDSLQERDCIVVCLWGQVKGEHWERTHLLPCVNVTSSGIAIRRWITRALTLAKDIGRVRGPLMLNRNGSAITSRELDEVLHLHLATIYGRDPNLFPSDTIREEEDIYKNYSVFRSFRRGSNTQAKEGGVLVPDIDTVNRWRVREKAGTSKPGGSMHHIYADLSMLVGPFLRYTKAM